VADVSIIIKAIDQATNTLSGVTGELEKMDAKGSKLGGVLKGGLVLGAGAAVAGIGALGAVLGTSISAASEAEEIQAQLNAVLKSTGGVAGVSADAINDHAQALSEATRFEDDAIVASSALMLTFTKVGKDVFPDATEATLDMAQAMGMDLNSATMLVGKALNDPVKGMTALSRSGIQFTEDQKAMVQAMVDVGDTAGAQQIILKELETQFGGSAKAAGETFGGQLDIMKNALGNVGEEIGGALLPALTDMAIKMGPGLIEGAKKFADWAVSDLIPALIKIGEWLEINVPKAIEALKQAWIDAQPTVEVIKGIFQDIGEALGVVFEWLKLNVPKAIEALKQAWIDAQPTVEFIKQIFSDIGEALGVVFDWLGENVPKAIETLKQAWLDAQPTIEFIKQLFSDIGGVLGTVWDWLSVKIPSAVEAVKGAFDGAKGAIGDVIGLIQGFIDKISTALAKLNEFLGRSGGVNAGSAGGAGVTGGTRPGVGGTGATGGTGPSGMGGVRSAGATGWQFNITINAPGGNPQAVAAAAQTGILAAARSMGLA